MIERGGCLMHEAAADLTKQKVIRVRAWVLALVSYGSSDRVRDGLAQHSPRSLRVGCEKFYRIEGRGCGMWARD